MITAVLAPVFVWCLFYGQIPLLSLSIICVVFSMFFTYSSGKHSNTLSVDTLAQMSRLKNVNAALKFWTLLALMTICVASRNTYTGIFLFITLLVFAVFVCRLNLYQYIHILMLPISFLLIGGLALLFEVSYGQRGVLNLELFGFCLSVSLKSQLRTALVVSRALGAVSCLCLLSVTTPMPDIIGVLRQIRCPELIIDLMYLIYRYIFILLSLHRDMHNAAKSRLGFRDYKTALNSTGKIYANLLARSYQFASHNFDAMESRCYNSGIRFLTRSKRISLLQITISITILFVSLCLSLFSQ